jgi:hypothetical protein
MKYKNEKQNKTQLRSNRIFFNWMDVPTGLKLYRLQPSMQTVGKTGFRRINVYAADPGGRTV